MPAFKIYHDPYVTCDEDRYLSQCAFDAAGILCQHRDIIKSLDNSKFRNIFTCFLQNAFNSFPYT